MTWYASHIYAEPKPDVCAMFAALPMLSNGMYLIKDLKELGWLSDDSTSPSLLVIREMCQPGTREAAWHEQGKRKGDALSWVDISSREDIEVLSLAHLPVAGNGKVYLDSEWAGQHPPLGFLRFLKHISKKTGTTVSFYHHASGAEQTQDQEFAWIFGKSECVYVKHDPAWGCVTSYTQSGRQSMSGNILELLLRDFKMNLDTSQVSGFHACFTPHTRTFEWERYKIKR